MELRGHFSPLLRPKSSVRLLTSIMSQKNIPRILYALYGFCRPSECLHTSSPILGVSRVPPPLPAITKFSPKVATVVGEIFPQSH